MNGKRMQCPLLAKSRHSSLYGFMSAFGGKADIVSKGAASVEILKSVPIQGTENVRMEPCGNP